MRHLTLLLFAFALGLSQQAIAAPGTMNNTWRHYSPASDTVFVFVHGIFSNSKDCWTAANGAYWPDIVWSDSRFGHPSVFLGGYYTALDSGAYGIPHAASQLLSHLTTKDPRGTAPPLSRKNVIFVAHSTGGLVVRYLIERNQDILASKHLGLVLVASPSSGSAWANRMKGLIDFYGNDMARELSRDNELLADLDSRFHTLISKRRLPYLLGLDLFENHFIVHHWLLPDKEYLVSPADSQSYFGAYEIVPDTDHFTIAKPPSVAAESHVKLADFFINQFLPTISPPSPPPTAPPPPPKPAQPQNCTLRVSVVKDDHYQTGSTYRFVVLLATAEVFNQRIGDEIPHGRPYGEPFENWSEFTVPVQVDTTQPPPLVTLRLAEPYDEDFIALHSVGLYCPNRRAVRELRGSGPGYYQHQPVVIIYGNRSESFHLSWDE